MAPIVDTNPENSGFYLDLLVDTGKPSLAVLDTVSKLVRSFAARVLDIRAAWHAGGTSARDPLAAIEAEARVAGDIVLGRNPAFDAQPWNSPRRLGIQLRALVPEETAQYGDPGTALFMWLANQAVQVSKAIEDGAPEVETRERLADVCDDVTARILGIRA